MTLIDEYLAILNDLDGDEAGRRAARAYLETSTNIYRGHVVACDFMPKLYDERLRDRMAEVAKVTYGILEKVMDRYLADPEYRRVFDFDPRLEELILCERHYPSHLPFARIDLFLDEETLGVKFCEFNADGSSGMNENREAENAIATTASFAAFAEQHRMVSMNPVMFEGWVREFLRIYASSDGAVAHPHVAIADYLEQSVTEEFKLYRELFRAAGVECSIYDVRDMTYEGGRLIGHKPYEGLGLEDAPIDCIWRRAVANDVLDNWDASSAFLTAFREGAVILIGSFLGHLAHDKQIFKALADERTHAFLTSEEIAFIDSAIPKTFYLDSHVVDLQAIAENPDGWVIKPTDGYGSREVYPGPAFGKEEWAAIVAAHADGASGAPFLVQEWCTPYKTPAIPLRGDEDDYTREPAPYNNLQGLYLMDGELAGIFTRLGPRPLILGRHGGLTAPSFWVDCDSPFAGKSAAAAPVVSETTDATEGDTR